MSQSVTPKTVHTLYSQIFHNIKREIPKNSANVGDWLNQQSDRYEAFEGLSSFDEVQALFAPTHFSVDITDLYDHDTYEIMARSRFACFVAHFVKPGYGHHVAAIEFAHAMQSLSYGRAQVCIPYLKKESYSWLESELVKHLASIFQLDFDDGSAEMVEGTKFFLEIFEMLGLNINSKFSYAATYGKNQEITIGFAVATFFDPSGMEDYEVENYKNILALCIANGVELRPYRNHALDAKNEIFLSATA